MIKEVVKLEPVIRRYIWGGEYFSKFNKGEGNISELWEVAVRFDDSSFIPSLNTRLDKIIDNNDIGPISHKFPYFPLLVKLIDAKENLSVQVHPSDEYALKYENSYGKTEMWYVLSHEEGAGLYIGLNRDYSKEEIKDLLEKGKILDALNFFPVNDGDYFLIPSGTIHAIGTGIRVIEIQQNSDLTYRLYDYDRVDKNGNKRELHIKKALEVINLKKYVRETPHHSQLIEETPYFDVEKVEIKGEQLIDATLGDSFVTFTFISGEGNVNDIDYHIYDSFFLPHGKKCLIKGTGTIILSYLKDEKYQKKS